MIGKNIVKTIQTKEMDRKDFLKFGAMAIVGVIGLKGVVSLLTSNQNNILAENNKHQTSGYGSSAYGA